MRLLDPEQKARLDRLKLKREHRETIRIQHRKAKRLKRQLDIVRRQRFAAARGITFDPNLEREQIILPKVFSFHENFAETMGVIAQIRDIALVKRGSVLLHFSDVEKIDPSAALVLVAEIFRVRKLRSPTAVSGTYPRLAVIYYLLLDMGFYQLLNIQELEGTPKSAPDPTRPVFLKLVTDNRVQSELVDLFVALIEKHVIPLNAVARGRLVAAIIEAMNNTLDHAHPVRQISESMTHRWWMSSWVNVVDKEVMVMLFDQGVGIPETLDSTLYEQIRALLGGVLKLQSISAEPTDGEKIAAATELHRTSTGQRGRGKGFRNMKQFVDICRDGELRVLSNRGRYRYVRDAESYENEAISIGGTVIEWRFRNDEPMEMKDD